MNKTARLSSYGLTLLPFAVLVVIAMILSQGLKQHPAEIPSPLVGQPAPSFSLPVIGHPGTQVTQSIFQNHITLLNIWASWCEACHAEHPLLMQIAGDKRFMLVGLNYRDNPDTASAWLRENGNPYILTLSDETGRTGIDWGVYGTPETFVIDKKGMIRHRQIGVISPQIWRDVFEPLLTALEKEP